MTITPAVRTRARWAGGVLMGMLSIAFVILAWPASLGGQVSWVMVSGTSMEPAYHTGDMVVSRHGGGWKVGDVVIYSLEGTDLAVAGASSPLIVHRIIAGNAQVGWTIQGDNKPYPDPWTVPDSAIQGVEVFTIPKVGTALTWVRTPQVMAILAGILVFWAVLAGPNLRKRRMVRVPVDEPAVVAGRPAAARDLHIEGARFLVSADEDLPIGTQQPVEVWIRTSEGSRAIVHGVLTVRYDNHAGETQDAERYVGGPVTWSTPDDVELVRRHCEDFALPDKQSLPGSERKREGLRRWLRV